MKVHKDRCLRYLGSAANNILLAAVLGFLLYRTAIKPWSSSLALAVWTVTALSFFLCAVLRIVWLKRTGSDGLGIVLRRSYNGYLPVISTFLVLFTLNALKAAPLASETLKQQPNLIIPILIVHAVTNVVLFAGFYWGKPILELGVATGLVLLLPHYVGANLCIYGTLYLLILAIGFIRAGEPGAKYPSPSALDIPLLAFLGLATISTLASQCFWASALPLVSIVTSIGAGLLIAVTTKRESQLLRLVLLATLGGVFLAAIGGAKLWLVARNLGPRFALTNRLWLPGINPNSVAANLTLTIPLMLAVLLARVRRWLSVAFAAMIVVAIGCLVLSYSKGGWLGFAAAMISFGLLRPKKKPVGENRRRTWATVAIILVVSLLLGSVFLGEVGQKALQRFADPISVSSRAFFWSLAQHVISTHPLIGVGLANTYLHARSADKVPTGLEVDVRQNVLSHSHSTYLHLGEGTGILGLCAYLFLLVTFITRGIFLIGAIPSTTLSLICRGTVASIIGYAVHGLFDLDFFVFSLFCLIGITLAAERVWHEQAAIKPNYTRGAWARAKALFIACFTIMALLVTIIQVSLKSELIWPSLASAGLSVNPQFFERLAEQSIQQDRFEAATKLLEKAIARRRDYALYHEKLGWLYWLLAQPDRAAKHFMAAVECDPLGAIGDEHYSALGLFLFSRNLPNRAQQAMLSAVQTRPSVVKRGIWQFVPGESVEESDWVIRPEFIPLCWTDASSKDALKQRLIAHLKGKEEPPKMVVSSGSAEAIFKLSPGYAAPMWSLRVILHQLYEKYCRILATDPLMAKKILLNVAKAYYYVGWDAEAKRTFKEGIKFFYGDINFKRGLAILYTRQKRYKRAADLFAQAGDNYSEGIVWLEANQLGNAISAFSKLLASQPEHQMPEERAKALTMLGAIYERIGGSDSLLRAKHCYEKALLFSQSAADYKRLSDVLYALGEERRAKELFRKAQQLHQAGQPLETEPFGRLIMQ